MLGPGFYIPGLAAESSENTDQTEMKSLVGLDEIENGTLVYGRNTYWYENERLLKNGEPLELGLDGVERIALSNGLLFAVCDGGETWVLIDGFDENTPEATASASQNEQTIYQFAVDTLCVNTAVACGILSNIQAESSFDPTCSCIDTNGLTSYGICQWNGGRFTGLKSFCNNRGLDYTTLNAQLQFLQYELSGSEKSAFNKVKSVENTAQGAYEAGYRWAQWFERCNSAYFERRAVRARDVFWSDYGSNPSPTTAAFNPLWPLGNTWPTTKDQVNTSSMYISTMYRYYNNGSPSNHSVRSNFHNAFDVGAARGTNIYAIESGRVVEKNSLTSGFGNYIVIEHFNGLRSLYGHMNQHGSYNVGDTVSRGAVIGYCGSTGNSTGNHLHFELYDHNNYSNITDPWGNYYQGKVAMKIAGTCYRANQNYTSSDPYATAFCNWLLSNNVSGSASEDYWFVPDQVPPPTPPPIPTDSPDNKLLNPMVFNLDFIRASRLELRGLTDEELTQHWLMHGIHESAGSQAFDVKWYKNYYSAELGNFSDENAIIHFVDHGVHEGRKSSKFFSLPDYKANYQDLQNAFGNNNALYCLHYIDYGWGEGRIANRRLSIKFDANGGSCGTTSQNYTCYAPYGPLPTPTRQGYTFTGWYTDRVNGDRITAETQAVYADDTYLVVYAHWESTGCYLDVKGYCDGVLIPSTEGYGTFDVYINGVCVKNDIQDFYQDYPFGTSYEIRDVKPLNGYTYLGIHAGTRQGTLNGNEALALNFSSIDTSGIGSSASTLTRNNHVYEYYPYEVTWHTAKQFCEERGGHLATVTSDEENTLIGNLFRDLLSHDGVWLGGTRISGSWQWVTGEPFTFGATGNTYPWNSGEPNDYPSDEGGENYLDFSSLLVWNDNASCSARGFIFEKEIETYTVQYDANGGNGAPATQTKTHGVALTLSSTVPTRTGFTFLGWAESSTATSAQYQPGGSFSKDADTTLYAVWNQQPGEPPVTDEAAIRIAAITGRPGSTVELPITLENNPGISSMKLTLHFDSSVLSVTDIRFGERYANLSGANCMTNETENSVVLNWILTTGQTDLDGLFATVCFTIDPNAEQEDTTVTGEYDLDNVYDENYESVAFRMMNGSVKVIRSIPGDINCDGKINNKDSRLLFQYVSDIAPTQTFDVGAADVNGDGKINNKDARVLFQYVTGIPVILL